MKEAVVEEMHRQVEHTNGVNGVGEKYDFNPSAQPPFKIAATRAAIPKNCWVTNPWSLLLIHFTRDEFVVFVLATATIYFINSWSFWPLYWAAQRTMFWVIVVLGHDCGHGSFVVVALAAAAIYFNTRRISLRTHHLNYGSVENDKSWVPYYL
ncbi:acyl-lipid omega-3 desaturase (cytochrome b5) [Quercus suber]|uniref:Acyl-lipid omega-3 desaturase (Cytochrome b5) n=1 Tax=Quercus suber TaxID=58331 RepID=A0AAW0KYF5_QUESU